MVTVTERIQWHGSFFTTSTANEVFWLNLHYTGTYTYVYEPRIVNTWMDDYIVLVEIRLSGIIFI